jgi:hypothetical protein
VQQLTRKLLHKKRKKFQISATKARRLRFLAIDLAKNFAQNPSICLFLEPLATISAKSKTLKTASLCGESLVKSIVVDHFPGF